MRCSRNVRFASTLDFWSSYKVYTALGSTLLKLCGSADFEKRVHSKNVSSVGYDDAKMHGWVCATFAGVGESKEASDEAARRDYVEWQRKNNTRLQEER